MNKSVKTETTTYVSNAYKTQKCPESCCKWVKERIAQKRAKRHREENFHTKTRYVVNGFCD